MFGITRLTQEEGLALLGVGKRKLIWSLLGFAEGICYTFFSCWAKALCRHKRLLSAFKTGLSKQAAWWEAPLVSSESIADVSPDLSDPRVTLFLPCFLLVLLKALPASPPGGLSATDS